MADKKKAKPMTPRIEVFDGLTVEEARFCAGYVAHGDRTRALKESGYGFNSDMSAYDRARQLLAKPSVQKELKRQTRLLKPETFLSDTERTELSKARDAMGERSEGLYREKLHLQNGLTIREQRFCVLVAAGKPCGDSYGGAGFSPKNAMHASQNSARLLRKEAVKREIAALLAASAVAGSITKDKILHGIFEHTKSESENTALKAWELLGKSVGLFTEDKAKVNDEVRISINLGKKSEGVTIEGERVGG